MDRKLISHRIGSILDDISRLSNALYALDTTDIQRYPDNYETLSTDAALRAERIACRLRHLIYSSTTICKGDYLRSAGVMHGIIVYGKKIGDRCYGAINLHEGKVGVSLFYATLVPDCDRAKMYADKLAEMVPGFIFQIRGAGTRKVYYEKAGKPEESV